VTGSKRLALSDLPIFYRKFKGAQFDSALMDLQRLYRRASAAAMASYEIEWIRELRANPLHRWLEKSLPQTLSHAPPILLARIRFVLDVLSILMLLDVTKTQQEASTREERADKKRTPVLTSIDRLEDALENGVLVLTRAKRSMLRQILSESKAELAVKRSKSDWQKHPGLVYLSQVLALENAGKRARRDAIIEVSAFVDPNVNGD
jgi:hypothetical protein